MNDAATKIMNHIGARALAEVVPLSVEPWDDMDTPGLEIRLDVSGEERRVLITELPGGLYGFNVFDFQGETLVSHTNQDGEVLRALLQAVAG